MSATSRLKQLLFIVAGLALVVVGLSGLTTAAQADDTQPCEPTEDQVVTQFFETDPGAPWVPTGRSQVKTPGTGASLTAWVNEGAVVRTEENVAPDDPDNDSDESSHTNLVKYVSAGTVEEQVQTGTQEVFDHWQRYSLTGGSFPEGETPAFPNPGGRFRWVANVEGDPHGVGQAGAYSRSNEQSGNTDWFYLEAVMKEVPVFETDIDYLWQKQVRSVRPGTDEVLEYEYTMTIEGVDCPDEEPEGKKVVVCKYVGTPPGTPDHIIVVSVNALPGFDPETSTFPFPFGDAQDSIAIRYAVGNEQPGDEELENCPVEEPECPEGDHNGEMEGCEEPECPEGDHNGDAEGCEEEPEECPDGDHNGEAEGCEEEDDDEKCPKGTDHAGENIDEVESCDDDPIIDPGEGEGPGKNPGSNSNNPGNSPSSNPQGSNLPTNPVAPVSAPGADVPSAVNAGLLPTQRELAGAGNDLGLIGMSTALLGLGLLMLTLRPRRGRKLAG